ncbi:CRISPR-associated endonuclease Cas2 [Nitrospirales bacterium NOB]|nr:CRISPR-associated endonuclease Cas2 [Nitrospirales bacterium NOB]
MKRIRYLIAYDIRDPKRLRFVHKVMVGHGAPLQYSVFICDLSHAELCELKLKLRKVAKFTVDSIVVSPLGEAYDASTIQFLGARRVLPSDEPLVF